VPHSCKALSSSYISFTFEEAAVAKFRGNPWAVLLVISLGFFMTLLDLTIVNIAIPNMISRLHASLDDILWVINGYALVLAVLVITAGRLGDLRGPRSLFAAGVALFTIASAACGLATDPAQLIAFRVVQGLGAAMLMPQTLAIITHTFPPERRGAAFGVWGAVAGVATVAGPTLGGLLVTAFDWRWIFFINVPVGALVLTASFLVIPAMRPGGRHRLDITGVVLASASLLAICYGLIEGQRYNWGTITGFLSIPLVIGAGVVLLGIFLLVQARSQGREPLVPFALFRERNFSLMNIVMGALAIGMMGIFLPLTIYLQSVVGMTALRAGLTMAPASIISVFLAPVAGRMADRVGGKYLLMTGLTLFGAGMAWVAVIAQPASRWYDFLAPLLVAGTGMGCIFAPMSTVALRNVKPQLAGAASGVLNTNRQAGAVIGTAAVGALLQNRLAASLTSEASMRSAALPAAVRPKFVGSFQAAAKSGLQVGSGQSGGTFKPPAGMPASLAADLARLAHEVFGTGFVSAMRVTMILPIAVIGLAVLCCIGIRSREDTRRGPEQAAPEEVGTPV
jgi:EmrB/QacA subfamily drug resistance transporter